MKRLLTLLACLVAAGAAQATTLNPADKAVNAVLSNGNLTITTAPAAYSSARSTTSKTTGKWYFEITIDAVGGSVAQSWGIADSTASLTTIPGIDTHGSGFSIFDDSFRYNNTQNVGSLGTMAATVVIGVAIDFTNKNYWIVGPSGLWDGNLTADPATNTRGVSCPLGCLYPNSLAATLFSGIPVFAMISVYDGSQATVNFGATPFSRAIPAGFTGWDLIPLTARHPIRIN